MSDNKEYIRQPGGRFTIPYRTRLDSETEIMLQELLKAGWTTSGALRRGIQLLYSASLKDQQEGGR